MVGAPSTANGLDCFRSTLIHKSNLAFVFPCMSRGLRKVEKVLGDFLFRVSVLLRVTASESVWTKVSHISLMRVVTSSLNVDAT